MISLFWVFSLAHVPSANMEGKGIMTYTSASHQGSIKMFWLHFWGAVMSSIYDKKQQQLTTPFSFVLPFSVCFISFCFYGLIPDLHYVPAVFIQTV